MAETKQVGRFQIDMCTGPILPKMLRFALPLMATNLLQLMFSAADSIVVGRFAGDASLAAVGSTVSLISLMTNLFLGLSVGANVVAARDFGRNDNEALSRCVHTSLIMALVSGIILNVIGFFGARQLLVWMQTPDDILDLAVLYLRIYFFGMTPMILYNFGSALLRAVGDTKRPLYYLLLSGALNILLNLLFVIALRMDVAGVALATILTQTLSAALILVCLAGEKGGIRFEFKKLACDHEKLGQIAAVGLPAGIQSSMFSISNCVVQASINLFGKVVVAANAAAVSLEDMLYFAMSAFQHAVTSFTGQNMGPRRFDRIRRTQLCGQLCVIATALIISAFEFVFAPQLLSIFTDSPEVVPLGVERLRLILPLYFVCGVMDVFVGGLRGMGASTVTAGISLVGICGFRLFWLTVVFPMERFHAVTTVYLVYPITWLITATAEAVFFFLVLRKKEKSAAELS